MGKEGWLLVGGAITALSAMFVSLDRVEEKDPFVVEQGVSHGIAYSAQDVYCLAKNIFHEAATESDLGKYAVAQVTLNRVRDERWGRTVCAVVYEKNQFSWTNNKKLQWAKPSGELWQRSKEIAADVLMNGAQIAGLNNAVFYHADYVRPRWANDSARIVKIDTHIFYHSTK